MSQNKLYPILLCCRGCSILCHECAVGCGECCQSLGSNLKSVSQYCSVHCTCCNSIFDNCCGELCNCKFQCSNPCFISDTLPLVLSQILTDYDFIGEDEMYCYGKVQILQNRISQSFVTLKQVETVERKEAQKLIQKWSPRIKQRFPHILQLMSVCQRKVDGYFRKRFRTYLMFEYILADFKDELEVRIKNKQYFTTKDIYSFMLSVLSGLVYLQNIGVNINQVHLNHIYLDQNGVFKLLDPTFFDSKSPLEEVIENNRKYKIFRKKLNSYYFAPEQIDMIIQESRLTSCLFTFAIKVFEIVLLQSMNDCYQNDQLNLELLINRRDEVGKIVPIEMMSLLNMCILLNPEERIKLNDAFIRLLHISDVQQIIQELPEEFNGIYEILNNESQQQQYGKLEKVDIVVSQPLSQQPQQLNSFQQLLRQKNYAIGGKLNSNNAFTKLLEQHNYQLGQRQVKNRLDLESPHDSILDILKEYQTKPLINYVDLNENQKEDTGGFQYINEQYPNGCIYQGYKLKGMREGKGKYIHPNGTYYEGDWKENKMDGQGKFFNHDMLIYDGEWKNDEFNGYGREYNEDPDNVAKVDYKDLGKNLEQIWMTYEGEFRNDQREGVGKMEFVNGGQYVGQFIQGMPNGYGKYIIKNESFKGQWENGRMINNHQEQ